MAWFGSTADDALSGGRYDPQKLSSPQVFLLSMLIFLAIAGTYTPVTLLSLPGGTAWLVFGLVWGMALTGIVLRFTWYKGFQYLSVLLYLGMGWIGFAWADQLIDGLGAGGVWLIIAGGLCYSGGVVFYALRRLPFNHAIWHLCVLGGAVCHFLAVQLYAMPSVL